MVTESEFFGFAAGIFGVPAERLSFETTYGGIPEWDSMAQLRLVTEIAAKYGVEIPFAEVTTVTSLWEFFRRVNALSPKKVVAVDLDGTLWDGVIGEDGADGIRPRTGFLRELKALKDRGILLVALSKNDEGEGLRGLRSLKGLKGSGVLGEDDFVTWRINWACKAENLVQIAAELNLGVDAFVFVDDNPAERIEMSAKLPEVTVAAFPPNLDAYFPPWEITEEDRRKTEEYKAEAQRKVLLRTVPGIARKIFEALDVKLDVHGMTDGEAARVAQLSQKANQFNVCTNRYTEDEIRRLGRENLVVTVRSRDRFGDQGLVSYVIVKIADAAAEIVDWVMSCRTMGRGIEERVAAELERMLKAKGVRTLRARWVDSGRNAPVKDLFVRLGFACVENTPICASYCKDL